jgi:hypothetical protein
MPSIPATCVIVNSSTKKRHPYCAGCYREALRQAPINSDEKVKPANPGEICEECKEI